MAKFVFRLGSVLGIKEKVEDLKKNEFGKAMMELAQARRAKAEMEQERDHNINEFRNSVSAGINPLEIHRYNLYIEKLKQMIIRQDRLIAKAEAYAEQKRAELVEAMRDRKTLETLKENDYEEFLNEEKKAEQKVVDEIISYRGSLN